MGCDWERYGLYGQCLADLVLEGERAARSQGRSSEPGLRRRGQGLEPRLAPGLRQSSRRRQRQQMLDGASDEASDGDSGSEDGADPSGALSLPDPAN